MCILCAISVPGQPSGYRCFFGASVKAARHTTSSRIQNLQSSTSQRRGMLRGDGITTSGDPWGDPLGASMKHIINRIYNNRYIDR